jgi:quercetin dioxygenase-like cupin family protein
MDRKHNVRTVEVVLQCPELSEALAFFVEILGFRVDTIFPADDPSVAVVSAYGVSLRLQRSGAPVPDEVPPNRPSFVLSKIGEEATWKVGRADMRYRDLIPGRQGGRFIASHIRIPQGGEVPDYVHFHNIRFQMIYCYRGWVRVVYEDQGPPFVLNAGDCVLQPPQIRHRVLDCSAGLEVIEIGCPAEHATHADHELALPTKKICAQRDFHGQRFVRHVAQAAAWQPWRAGSFESRDTGIAAATEGLAGARVVRLLHSRTEAPQVPVCSVDAEFLFTFVLQGSVSFQREEQDPERLEAGDCFTMPAGLRYGLTECSDDLEFLEVSLPAGFETL